MLVRLEVSNNKSKVKRITLRNSAVIGRGKECNLRVASSQVSRRHCKISITEAGVRIRDLGSANGTFLNGEPLPPQKDVPISSGAQISIGPVRFTARFEILPTSADAPGSTVEMPVVAAEQLSEPVSEKNKKTAGKKTPAAEDFDFDEAPQDGSDFDFGDAVMAESDEEYEDEQQLEDEAEEEFEDEEDEEEQQLEDEAEEEFEDEDEQQLEEEDEEGEYEDEEPEPPRKKGKIRSLFGFLGRKKRAAADDDEAEEEYEDEEYEDESEEELEDETAADEEEATVVTQPKPEPVADGASENDVAGFLSDMDSGEDEQDGSPGTDDLGDFLSKFEDP